MKGVRHVAPSEPHFDHEAAVKSGRRSPESFMVSIVGDRPRLVRPSSVSLSAFDGSNQRGSGAGFTMAGPTEQALKAELQRLAEVDPTCPGAAHGLMQRSRILQAALTPERTKALLPGVRLTQQSPHHVTAPPPMPTAWASSPYVPSPPAAGSSSGSPRSPTLRSVRSHRLCFHSSLLC
jgi:hypothetical protein